MCSQDAKWTGTAKLGDLGLSREADPDTGLLLHQFEGLCGTLPYMAPEIFQAQAVGKAIDVYAFGALLWELHHMAVPRAGLGTDELIGHMLMGGGLPRCLPDIDPATFMIMLACTRAQPAARPSFAVLQQAVQLLLVDQPHSCSLHVAQACMRLGLCPGHSPIGCCQWAAWLTNAAGTCSRAKAIVTSKDATTLVATLLLAAC